MLFVQCTERRRVRVYSTMVAEEEAETAEDHMLLWSMGDEKTDDGVEAYHEARGDNCTTSTERQGFNKR